MISFVNDLHPMVLDVVFVCLIVLIITFGALKSFKSTIIDFLILSIALFLGFSPYTNDIKKIIAVNLLDLGKIAPAGSANSYVLGISLSTMFFAALLVFVSVYLLLHVIKWLIKFIVKKSTKGKVDAKKTIVGRIFGGLISFIYQSFILIVVIFCMNNNLVGLKGTIENSKIVGLVVANVEELVNIKDDKLCDKIVVKIFKGDMTSKVSDELVVNFRNAAARVEELFVDKEYTEIIGDAALKNEQAIVMVKERIYDLNLVAVILNEFDEFGVSKEYFSKTAEEWFIVMNRKIVGDNLKKIELSINEQAEIRLNLINTGISEEVIKLYDEIVVGK